MPLQRSHHASPGKHRWPVKCGNQQERLHRGLPFFGIVFCLGQFSNALRGVTECDQRLSAWHHDRIEKPLIPGHERITALSPHSGLGLRIMRKNPAAPRRGQVRESGTRSQRAAGSIMP
jgi:hypothetical protein